MPAHGFARNQPWTLSAHNEDANGVVLTFELHNNEETLKLWPHEFTLYARFKLGKTCEIELEAHGEFETTSALHTYFNVGDIADVKVSGLGKPYIDKVLNEAAGQLTDGVQTFPDRTDRLYLEPEEWQRHSRRKQSETYPERGSSPSLQRGGLEPGSGAVHFDG
ncbi:Putative glucose-6-phosphate 1-epimerase [Cedecea neteri]|uniref:Glucose-6-phosphate 1-epimerase n=1 Tax=Cedecea neteri TaxID=158822 RepID=A0A2X3IP04_9ENTR|nr:Putative glucose-6-phosphate 1-epimerase [Cedecea neteri]